MLMDHTERLPDNTIDIHGSVIINGEERLTPAAEKNQMELAKLAYQVAVEKFSMTQPAGVVFWSGRKNIPSIVNGGAGVVLIWSRYSRKDYITQTLTSTERSIRVNQVSRRNDWQSLCGLLIYSYMSVSDDPEHRSVMM